MKTVRNSVRLFDAVLRNRCEKICVCRALLALARNLPLDEAVHRISRILELVIVRDDHEILQAYADIFGEAC